MTIARGLALLLGACLLAAGGAAQEAPKPNLLVVLCDDLGYGDLGSFGHPTIRTPNLDRFAAQGLKLTACYASAPVCSPSRAGMLTGRNAYRSGIYDWIPAGSEMHLPATEITLARLLKDAGYATAHIGKWHCNGKFNTKLQPQPGDHGFDYWFSTQNNAAPSHLNPTNFARNGRWVGPLQGHSSRILVDEAIAWLRERRPGEPFCLFLWFHSPHEPVATDEEYVALYPDVQPRERAIYYGNVTQTDAEFGRLMETLDVLRLRENTIVWFTSDNGPEYRTRHAFGSPGPFRGKKLSLYEGGIRVPGILRWPGRTQPGSVSDEPITNLDLLPTLCAALGIPVPADRPIDGASFLPALEGRRIERRTPLFWVYDRTPSGPIAALRDGDWKLLAFPELNRFELYDLKTDPSEQKDLAGQEPDRVRQMAATLRRLYEEVRAEGARVLPPPGAG